MTLCQEFLPALIGQHRNSGSAADFGIAGPEDGQDIFQFHPGLGTRGDPGYPATVGFPISTLGTFQEFAIHGCS
eukprot:3712076-Rhodomonas_salina.1